MTVNKQQLTNEDIDMLMKGLDALKSQIGSSALMGVMFSAMLTKKEERESDFEQNAKRKMEDANREATALDEQVILLKAKLIQMRDRSTVNEMSAILMGGDHSS